MQDDVQRVQAILDSFSFGGLWSTTNPVFKVSNGSDLKVEGFLQVPDRITKEPTQLTIIMYVARNSTNEQVRDSVIEWLRKFWQHEFYEGLFFEGKLVVDYHPGVHYDTKAE